MIYALTRYIAAATGWTIGGTLFGGFLPQEAPESCVAVVAAGGAGEGGPHVNDRATWVVRVLARSRSYEEAHVNSDWVMAVLNGKSSVGLADADGNQEFLIFGIQATALPQSVGMDDRRRHVVAATYVLIGQRQFGPPPPPPPPPGETFPLALTAVGSGTIVPFPAGIEFPSGDSVSVAAYAGAENAFTGFSGALAGLVTPQTLLMDAAKSVTATFRQKWRVTVSGATSYANVAGNYYLAPNFAVGVWLYPLSSTDMAGVFGTGWYAGTWSLSIRSLEPRFRFYDTTSTVRDLQFVTLLVRNTWTHVAVTYDGAVLRGYLNGVAVAATLSGSWTPKTTGTAVLTLTPNDITRFAGFLTQLRVGNVARTPAQVATDMLADAAVGWERTYYRMRAATAPAMIRDEIGSLHLTAGTTAPKWHDAYYGSISSNGPVPA